ncbi:hypothetical protein ACFQS1_03570 [Paractinoplanes rhizophilus]|uniref:Sporulation and cell division protein SsgA n=1 Tax=Paractinoplanes rhizophilus TaxID=1416877 RepID=A0ABW2HJ56_9ACTN|nr:hypothetical protein [Actinoplanes sp.]
MHVTVEVGTQLDPDVNWPTGAALSMPAGEPVQLMIFLSHPHQLEVEAVSAAPTQFAWVDGADAAVLLYRLGPILSWSQVPYSPHLADPDESPPGVGPDAVVRIVLVDRDTNTVKALHAVRWPAEFAATVRASVERMWAAPFSRLAYEHVLAGLHRRYPTPEDLLTDRADAHCTATPARS